MKITVRRNLDPDHRTEKLRIPIQQRGGKLPTLQKVLWPIKIFQKTAQQLRALDDACFDKTPLIRMDQQRHDVRLPGTVRALWIAVNIVSNSVFANAPFGQRPPARQFRRPDRAQRLHQSRPVWPWIDSVSGRFLVRRAIAKSGLVKIGDHSSGPGTSLTMFAGAGQRRSSVIGKTAFFSSFGVAIASHGGSEIWNRSRRRALASAASAGRVA